MVSLSDAPSDGDSDISGHSGCAVVEFRKDCPCLHDALDFEQAYEADHLSRKVWIANDEVRTELKKMQPSSYDHFQRIFSGREKGKLQKMLSEGTEKNTSMNHSLRLASLEQQKADDNVLKLAEEQKRQQEALHNRIIQLEQQLDAKQAGEMEIEQLRGTLNMMKHMEDDDDAEVMQIKEGVLKDLREKEEEHIIYKTLAEILS
ncbi:hypothetical protein MLD38_024154 [Melastoma candidum]|uniref:Uncharacterized protein n=1 Tax=Melastoma candidum TaxID=119954 RepID=A0ACB9NRG7_9MYRT|nr:hypothetical protein MLD38_024154 [Melastoma candidum]